MTAVTSVIGARVFELSYYGAWDMDVYKISPVTHQQMYLLSSSPGDGVVSDADMAAVVNTWATAVAVIASGTPAVNPVSPSQASSGAPPALPWAHGGYPRLTFDATWTMVGFTTAVAGAAHDSTAFLAIWSSTEAESFNAGEVASIASAIRSALASVTGAVSASQAAQIVLSPATVK